MVGNKKIVQDFSLVNLGQKSKIEISENLKIQSDKMTL